MIPAVLSGETAEALRQHHLSDVSWRIAGDSRAVLCRGGVAIPLTDDHKAAREDETVGCWLHASMTIIIDHPLLADLLEHSSSRG